MTTTVKVKKAWLQLYDGFDTKKVGLGAIDPDIFATPGLRKKKLTQVFLGGINRIIYSGWETDKNPLVLAIAFEVKYNTIIGYNLHYLPITQREAIIKFMFKSNIIRIKKKLPLLIDYERLEKLVPKSKGAIRRYKIVGVRVEEAIPLAQWSKVVKEKSKFSQEYKKHI